MSLLLAQNDLACYASAMWPPFQLAPHHRQLIQILERVARGELDRVIVCMPPRHGKSLITSTMFPAWFLGRNPTKSVIASSYGQELASDFGRRVRNFVAEPLHRQIFPDCVIADDSDAVHRFHLTQGGAYFAVGAGGPITGRGADILLIDDPIKSEADARSAAFRRTLQSWYESTAYTRLEPNSAVCVISTRWHEADLAGWLLKEHSAEGWKVISMPAIAEVNEGWRNAGGPLWPERFPLDALARIREAIGGSAWQSLYMQKPAPEQGAIFRKEWWRSSDGPIESSRVVFSLDCAFKTGQTNDYSVIVVMSESKNGYHVRLVSRGRWEFPELRRQVEALAEIWKPSAVLIEDAASGQSLVQALKAETRLPILPVRPQGDKVSRAHAIAPLLESGRVYLPTEAPWLADFVDELTSFPAAPHDDMVDSFTQALNWLRGSRREYAYLAVPESRSRFAAPASLGSGAGLGKQERRDAIDDASTRRSIYSARLSRSHFGGWRRGTPY